MPENYSFSVYADLECIVDPVTGSGSIILRHDDVNILSAARPGSDYSASLDLKYSGIPTEDEIQSLLLIAETCEQTLTFTDPTCWQTSGWTSLSKDVWTMESYTGCSELA